MAPQYKLTYFNIRGRAEVARLIFAVAGVEYEDERIEEDSWLELKPKTPFGQIPVLSIDGVQYCQSNSIARYLARKYNLAGQSETEQLQADMIVDCVEDAFKPANAIFGNKDETKKADLLKKLVEEQLPVSLAALEKLLIANQGGDGYFVGNSLTWADLTVLNVRDFLGVFKTSEEVDKHPKLKALVERVSQDPKVAAWLAKRPQTCF